jgi:hypothetical protein
MASDAAAPEQPLSDAAEWLQRIYLEAKGKPHESLFQYFKGPTRREDLTIHVLNLVNETTRRVFPDAPADGAQPSEAWRAERHYKAQCTQYVYYRCARGGRRRWRLQPRARARARAGTGR